MVGEIETERTRDMETPDLLTGVETYARLLRELLEGERRYLPEPPVGNVWRQTRRLASGCSPTGYLLVKFPNADWSW